jgi:hypothetical protein
VDIENFAKLVLSNVEGLCINSVEMEIEGLWELLTKGSQYHQALARGRRF